MTHRTILMISADADSTVALHDQFRRAGYDLRFAQNVEEALSIARRDLPQAIVLDTEVPGLEAARLIGELRSSPRTRHIHITLLAPQVARDARLRIGLGKRLRVLLRDGRGAEPEMEIRTERPLLIWRRLHLRADDGELVPIDAERDDDHKEGGQRDPDEEHDVPIGPRVRQKRDEGEAE